MPSLRTWPTGLAADMFDQARARRYFDLLRMLVFALLFIGVGVWGMRDLASEVYRLLFTAPRVCSIPELVKASKAMETEVTGIIDAAWILEEQTNKRRTGENVFTNFYYPLLDQDRAVGIYVYSELAPHEFLAKYGRGLVTLHGIWEETPKEVRIQEPMSQSLEQMVYLNSHMKSKDKESLFQALDAFHKQRPLVVWNRLNLHPTRYKFNQAALLFFSVVFFIGGVGLLWAAFVEYRTKQCKGRA